MSLNDTEQNENDGERASATPPIFKAASNLAAMQVESIRRLWEHGNVYAERLS
jgi:hypothetical protein